MWRVRAAILAVAGGSVFVTQAEELETAPLLPWWDYSISARTAAGYKDNVTLAHVAPQESPFISTGLEFLLWRLPRNGRQFQLIVSSDDFRYLGSGPVDKEQLAFAQAQFKQDFGAAWQASFTAEYFYQDQVIDVSTTEANLTTVHAVGQSFQAAPGLRQVHRGEPHHQGERGDHLKVNQGFEAHPAHLF